MGMRTNIEWADSTANGWTVCAEVSPGCGHCYARELARRRKWSGKWGAGVPRHRFTGLARNVAAMNRRPWVCDNCGESRQGNKLDRGVGVCSGCSLGGKYHRRRIFHGDLCDVLDPEAPAEWLAEWLESVRLAPDCTHIFCTKRPELFDEQMAKAEAAAGRMAPCSEWLRQWIYDGQPPLNVWWLASAEDQARLDERVPHLLRIPAAVRGLSLEPLLGPVDLIECGAVWAGPDPDDYSYGLEGKVDWVIVGGESGPGARPCDVAWVRSVKDQCAAASVPCFVKQMGSNARLLATQDSDGDTWMDLAGTWYGRGGRTLAHPKGGDMEEWPQDLRVRQWPNEREG